MTRGSREQKNVVIVIIFPFSVGAWGQWLILASARNAKRKKFEVKLLTIQREVNS